MKCKYSGKRSKKFWKKINTIENYNKQEACYALGVVLQNVESDILHQISIIKNN